MSQKRAIVSMAFGPDYQNLADLTFPTLRRYAARCEADFVVLGRREHEHVHYEKFQLYRLLQHFDRILWIDTDVIVRPDAPNLFDLVQDDQFAAYDESANHYGNCPAFMAEVAGLLGRPILDCPYYFNLGVCLQSRVHRQLYAPPQMTMPGDFPEQNHLNYRIREQHLPVRPLGCEWNCMADQQAGRDYWKDSHFVHHSFQPVASKIEKIKVDLARWNAGDYLPHGKTG